MINAVEFQHTPDITVLNQKQYDVHYGLYVGYVNSINELTFKIGSVSSDELDSANTTNGYYRGLKRGETYALDGVILHELYFRNIGGANKDPKEAVANAIQNDFDSFEHWRDDFVAAAKASRGWTILVYDQRTKRLRNICLDSHDDGMVALALPLLVIDMYEHAYYIQYGSDKGAYIEAFMENIHWDIVAQRMKYWGLLK